MAGEGNLSLPWKIVCAVAGQDAALWGERTKPRRHHHTEVGEAEQEESAEETRKELASQVGGKLSKSGVAELQMIVLWEERSIAQVAEIE